MGVWETLQERGFIAQCSNEEEVRNWLNNEKITMYCGYDPTADSLHVGHFLTLMALSHMQKAGHKVITLVGGGTASIGDPSGKDDMRKMLTIEDLDHNAVCLKNQISRFLDYSDDKAIMANNADWLRKLEYLPFLRDIAVHFSVNRMLSAECYKSRMEKGLTLLEFNYLVMQSYDFLELYRRHNCVLQVGGNDQWSNMIGGIDLIRKKERASANVLTFTLLTNSEGKKMGKTVGGAVWLNPEKMSPYDFFQYWRNVGDEDVKKCLSLLTFLPMDEVERLSSVEGAELNKSKEILAFETTKLVHGEEEAKKALEASKALFTGNADRSSMPTTELTSSDLTELDICALLVKVGLVPSKSEGRRAVEQGGVKINEEKVTDVKKLISKTDFDNNELLIQKGKKKFHLVKLI
ncbi:MAG: tyrosine--tRNA ligase [Clostridia bacterium]|jgi:tyrosyl-tRNA synthetase|nr:tyrosine--tRNA ligase [Clostridia bacterium]